MLTVCQICWQANASLPKPPSDLKNKIKSTPSATMGLSFELADLQGQNNQSENYPSPGKGYQAGKPSETIGAIPDKASLLPVVCPFSPAGQARKRVGLICKVQIVMAGQASQLPCSWPNCLCELKHFVHRLVDFLSHCVDLPQLLHQCYNASLL